MFPSVLLMPAQPIMCMLFLDHVLAVKPKRFALPTLGPGLIQQLIDIKVVATETLRDDCLQAINLVGQICPVDDG